MEAVGIRAMLGTPALPRIITRDPAPSPPDLPEGSRSAGRPADSSDPRRTSFRAERPATPGLSERSAPAKSGERLAAVIEARPPLPRSGPGRAPTPAVAIERIVEAATQVRPGKATLLRIALSPAHLGDLLIELTLHGPILHGRVLTESDAAKDLISAHLDLLREGLEGQGIQVGEFQVAVDRPSVPPDEDPFPAAGELEREEEGARLRALRRHRIDVLA